MAKSNHKRKKTEDLYFNPNSTWTHNSVYIRSNLEIVKKKIKNMQHKGIFNYPVLYTFHYYLPDQLVNPLMSAAYFVCVLFVCLFMEEARINNLTSCLAHNKRCLIYVCWIKEHLNKEYKNHRMIKLLNEWNNMVKGKRENEIINGP